jgi:hypothetical protein
MRIGRFPSRRLVLAGLRRPGPLGGAPLAQNLNVNVKRRMGLRALVPTRFPSLPSGCSWGYVTGRDLRVPAATVVPGRG